MKRVSLFTTLAFLAAACLFAPANAQGTIKKPEEILSELLNGTRYDKLARPGYGLGKAATSRNSLHPR